MREALSMPASVRMSQTKVRLGFVAECKRTDSARWRPTVFSGLRETAGSWKMMLAVRPRSLRSDAGGAVVMLTPSRVMAPAVRVTAEGSRLRSASAVRVLPAPLSPAIVRNSEVARLKEISSTRIPERDERVRFLTSRSVNGADECWTTCADTRRWR